MEISDWVPRRNDFQPTWISPVTFRKYVVRVVYVFVFGILVAGLLEAVLRYQNVNVVYPNEITILELLSTVGPILLSSLLAYLYYQQKNILSTEHRSNLSVTRFIGAEEDKIRLRLSNAGSGAIQHVLLQVNLEFEDGVIEGKTSYLELKEEQENTSRTFLKPYETGIFSKRLLLPVKLPTEENRRSIQFGSAMSLAESYGSTSGHLKLTLIWEDAIRDGRVVVFDEDFDIGEYDDFSQFIERYPEKSAYLAGGLD